MDGRIKNSGLTTHGFGSKRFSGEKYKFYDLYWGMCGRCNRKTHSSYHNYGARGIKCLWNSFEEFKGDMYESYLQHIAEYGEKNTSLDRIDNDGNYCKENCKRSTRREQSKNTRVAKIALVGGVKYSSRELAEKCGIGLDAARNRIKLFNKGTLTADGLLYIGSKKKRGGGIKSNLSK